MGLFFRVFFPDAHTALHRREIVLTIVVLLVAGGMWFAAQASGVLEHAPPFGD